MTLALIEEDHFKVCYKRGLTGQRSKDVDALLTAQIPYVTSGLASSSKSKKFYTPLLFNWMQFGSANF